MRIRDGDTSKEEKRNGILSWLEWCISLLIVHNCDHTYSFFGGRNICMKLEIPRDECSSDFGMSYSPFA
jgi:hypothetical protein